jgi:hypothetical protein
VAFCGLYVQRADIDRLSSGLVSDARVSEHHDAENDQYAGSDGFGSHGTSSFLASIRQTNGFLHRSSSLNEPDQHRNNGKHQQEVNKPSHRVTAHQAQQPQNHQYDSNRPQHKMLLSDSMPRDGPELEWRAIYLTLMLLILPMTPNS